MRYTGIIDAPELERVVRVEFETVAQGTVELAAFLHDHPGTHPVMDVGEPGDETPRWVVTVTPDGAQKWVVGNVSDTPVHNVELSLA